MKIEGIISYNNVFLNFVYENKVLRIYPKEINDLYDNIKIFTERFNERKLKIGEVISTNELYGTTFQGEAVVFYVLDYSGYDSGIITYDVIHYAKASKKENINSISKIEVKGYEIDLFYPAYRILEHNLKDLSININLIESDKISNINVSGHDISIYFSTGYTSKFGSNDPISAYSKMVVEFDKAVNLEETIEVIYKFTNFFSLINFRQNVQITEINIIENNKEENRYERVGEIYICDFHEKETKENKIPYYITIDDFHKDLLGLKKLISYTTGGGVNNSFLPKNGNDRVINRQKLLLQFSSFEKEFSNLFGKNKDLDDEYSRVRNEIRSYIEEKKANSTNLEEYNHFLSIIENDKPIRRKLKNVLRLFEKDFSSKEFIYVLFDKKERGRFVDVMGKLRNDLSHGELISEYPPGIAKYEESLQILILYLILKKTELSKDEITIILRKIFHIRLGVKLRNL